MKNIINTVCLIFFINLINAQIYTEMNAVGSSITWEGSLPGASFGMNYSVGYSFFNQKLDAGFSFEFQKAFDLENYNFFEINFVYKPFNWEYFKPYIGVINSRYKIHYSGFTLPVEPEFGYSISPMVGLLFKSDLIDGLYINLGYNYRYLTRPLGQDITLHTLSFGLKYYFNFMKNKKE
tara:strand:- start:2304 stop:2840 length:537 start_codon:yes stop_codon:yes gene_type:complete